MAKKIYIIGLVIFCAIAVGLIIWRVAYMPWCETKEQKIMLGLASPRFPYWNYSIDELEKMHPQVKNADVLTRVAPEETYSLFRQGLKENNLPMVLNQLSLDSARYEANVESIKKAFDEGRFGAALFHYPELIEQEMIGDALAQYKYIEIIDDKKISQTIQFIKNSDGDWKIDKL
jgi:hypothetical protein